MFFDFLYNSEKERCINLYGKIKSGDSGKSSKNVFETIEDNMEQSKNNTFQQADELAFDESRVGLWSGKYLKAIFVINEEIMEGVNFMDEKILHMENIYRRKELELEVMKQTKEKTQAKVNEHSPTFKKMLDQAKKKSYENGYDRGCCCCM